MCLTYLRGFHGSCVDFAAPKRHLGKVCMAGCYVITYNNENSFDLQVVCLSAPNIVERHEPTALKHKTWRRVVFL